MDEAEQSMNLWIFNHYAAPSDSQAGTRHFDMARELVARGHDVCIFSSGFNHMKRREERLLNGEAWKEECIEGVKFIWIRTKPYFKNDWRRAINILDYSVRVVFISLHRTERPDAIIGSSVHPLAALSARIVSSMKGSRFFFEVRDLWPQTLVDMGYLSEQSILTRLLRRIEIYLSVKAEKIITLLPRADLYFSTLGIPKEKVNWIPNGVNLARYDGIKEYGGGNCPFTLMYVGAHGTANALDVIIECAKLLQDKGESGIRFILVGDGPQKRNLIQYAGKLKLQNIDFRDPVPKEDIPKVMGEADAFIFHLEDLPLFRYGISSNKLFDYLAAGRPILFAANASNNPVEEAQAGITVVPKNPAALAAAVEKLLSLDPERRKEMGRNAREYVRKNHDTKGLALMLEGLLSNTISSVPVRATKNPLC